MTRQPPVFAVTVPALSSSSSPLLRFVRHLGALRRVGRSRNGPVPSDRGSSLVEIVVTVALLGIAGTAPLVAMQVAARGAALHQAMSVEQAALSSAADLLSSDITSWASCTTGEAALVERYQDEIDRRIDLAVRANVTGVDFWDGAAFGAACAASQGHRLQRIALQVATASTTASLDVVKRPPLDEVPTEGTVAVAGATEFENTIDHQATTSTSMAVPAATTTTTTTTTTATAPPTTTTTTAPAPTTTPTTTTTTTPTTAPPSTVPATSVPVSSVQCTATVGGWNQQVDVVIRNDTQATIAGWTLAVAYPSKPVIRDVWNVEWSVDANTLTASNISWNGTLPPRSAFSFGVQTQPNAPAMTSGQSLPCTVRSS
jgi:hypothetical protein